MNEGEPRKKQSLSTQELLSMNMDRLRGYMKKWGMEDAGSPREATVKRKSQRLVVRKPGREVLVLMHEPMHLAQVNNANDALPPAERFHLSRSQTFHQALDRMLESDFRLVVMDEGAEKAEEGRLEVSGLDALLILKGVMPKGDEMFLLRKQAFLRHFVPGDAASEKLANYKMLKRECASLPFVFLCPDLGSREAAVASVVKNVKSVPHEPDYATLFAKLGEALP